MNHIDRLTCEETFQRLNDYLDRELNPEEMRLVKEHLDICAVCASEYTFEASVLSDVRMKLQRIHVPADLRTKVSAVLDRVERGA
ncbi:MAG: zf-HC2 domain-containing protein [Candidatus Latescibacteria bacterium]|nr:zf-HC2 domain-containing protein [Candidatus Latescibacterota bacterium]